MTIVTVPLFVQGNASNTSQNGSTISYHLSPPINVGQGKTTFRVNEAEFWYSFPNISVAKSNYRIAWIHNLVADQYDFQDGLYSLDSINNNLRDYFVLKGLPEDLFVFSADVSTSKVSIELNHTGLVVTSEDALGIGKILGWTGLTTWDVNIQPIYEAPAKASLNAVNRVLVHANFVSGSYLSSKGGSDVVCSVQINVGVGRQILYRPNIPIEIDVFANHLAYVEFYVTDENGNRLDTAGEYWSLTGVLSIDTSQKG